MSLTSAQTHVIVLAAAVAAGCRGCAADRLRMVADRQQALHAVALGMMARERSVGGEPAVSASGDMRHYAGLFYREALPDELVRLAQQGAAAASGMMPEAASAEEGEAIALGYRAAARAALEVVAIVVPSVNAKNEAEWRAAGGGTLTPPGY